MAKPGKSRNGGGAQPWPRQRQARRSALVLPAGPLPAPLPVGVLRVLGMLAAGAPVPCELARGLLRDVSPAEASGEPSEGAGQADELPDDEATCRAALWAAVTGAFGPSDGALEREAFWRHCLAVALAAEASARRAGSGLSPLLAFACGLLHDVGKVALDVAVPKSYRRVLAAAGGPKADIAQAEREILGLDHALAGREVARHWGLPRRIEEVIWLHHHPLEGQASTLAGAAALIGLVQLADAIAREKRLGFSGNRSFPLSSVHLAELVGLSADDASVIGEALPDRLEREWAALRRVASSCARPAGSGGGGAEAAGG